MITQRTCSGGASKAAAIAGKAMLTIESSDPTNAPAAGISRTIAPPAGSGTVGTMVEMKHLAATPVGMKVRAKATLLETDGRRFLFAVEAWDEKEKIAEGRHERFVVSDMAKFLGRALKKAGG